MGAMKSSYNVEGLPPPPPSLRLLAFENCRLPSPLSKSRDRALLIQRNLMTLNTSRRWAGSSLPLLSEIWASSLPPRLRGRSTLRSLSSRQRGFNAGARHLVIVEEDSFLPGSTHLPRFNTASLQAYFWCAFLAKGWLVLRICCVFAVWGMLCFCETLITCC